MVGAEGVPQSRPSLLEDAFGDPAVRRRPEGRALLRHGAFAASYLLALLASVFGILPGSVLVVTAPATGVAVWWAVTCRSRSAFTLVCVSVFLLPSLFGVVVEGRPLSSAWLVGLAHVLAGPGLRPAMALAERVRAGAGRGGRRIAPLDRITAPWDVARLLVASLIVIPIAKVVEVVWLDLHDTASFLTYTSLVLRDLAGVMLVAGAGLAITSSVRRAGQRTPLRESVTVVAVTVVVLALVFGPVRDLPVVYLVLLPLLWSATRLPVAPAAVHGVVIAVATTSLASWIDAGSFAAPDAQAAAIRVLIVLCVLLSLVVATTRQQVREAREETHDLVELSPQGVATVDGEGEILRANRALAELLGVPAGDLPGRRLDEFGTGPGLDEAVRAALAAPGTPVHVDHRLECHDGGLRHVALALCTTTHEDAAPAVLVTAVDETERRELRELVSYHADHDPLTGLVNRRRVERELERLQARDPAADGGGGALLLIDLDHVTSVNDLLGHAAGDEVLVECATLLRKAVRTTDIVGRTGGDEFAVVLPDADREAATTVGAHLVEAVRERFRDHPDVLPRVSASVGIATIEQARRHRTGALVLAGAMLEEAERSGRNRYAVLDADDEGERLVTPRARRDGVEHLLDAGAVTLELQPIVEVATGRVIGAEALVRGAPPGPTLATGDLIAAAERAGLGPRLDALVLRKGIALLPGLQRARPGFLLSLGLSAQSVGSEEVARVVATERERHRVPRGTLVLVLAEPGALEDPDAAVAFRRALHRSGVLLSVGEFGTSCDPYRSLVELDPDIVTIAGEFVEGMVDGLVERSVVRSVVRLADELGMPTVAGSVSTEQVLDAVRDVGATHALGVHLGGPLPPDEFLATYPA